MRKIFAVAVAAVCGSVACASSVWVGGAEREMNAFYGFSATFDVARGERPVLRLAAGAIARVWMNGKFVGYGPARAPEGYMRMDEWPLSGFAVEGRNILAIEVSNPAINTFYLPEQRGFLFAEVVAGGRTLAATGHDFKAMRLPRVQKTSRFSYQREFAEFYAVTPEAYAWRTNGVAGTGLPLVEVPTPRKLDRGAPYPTFALDGTFRPVLRTVLKRNPGKKVKPLKYIDQTGKGSLKGFARDSLDVNFSDAIQPLVADKIERQCGDAPPCRLTNLQGVVFEGARNTAGFPKIEIVCLSPATVWLVMDELAGEDGLPNPVRFFSCVNACGWRLEKPGRYSLECFQPYGLKCAHVIVEGGEAEVLAFDLRSYRNPVVERASFRCSDPALDKVFAAAAQSLACNAVDVFTDCPGRERGAYFGDTVFTGRGADVLLGDTAMERTQFENYALAPRFADVPEGLIPMLYPGDTMLGSAHWIPNFCLWSVIQLADYVRRSGDSAMAAAFRPKAEGVLAWFRRSRNAEGLLENLPGWVFIEWSDAAKFTKGVNYPTNMLYIRFLDAFAELYGESGCRDEAECLRGTIRRLSWNGEWFRDHSVRGADGALSTPGDCTEVCQYLAFFSGVATAVRNPELWRRLVEEMGPMRTAAAYPAIHRSNLLFGYSLRFVLLSEAGLSARVLNEVRHCYLPMAEKTGTLWEAVSSDGYSCCHGFPSLAAWLLVHDALGVTAIDRTSKTVNVNPAADLPIDWCEGKIPVSDRETIDVKWRKKAGRPSVQVDMPPGWRLVRTSTGHAETGERASFGPLSPSAVPCEREYIWPEGEMPDAQPHQVAAKNGEKKAPGFKADDFRRPYLDWYAPNPDCKTDLCVITVSGGGFLSCCDAARLQPAIDRLVQAGITVADLTYRTPRPKGLPIHQSAWEDLQRAVRVVRSQAAKRGFNPEKIGATGISAGAKAVLLVATSSLTPAYAPVDEIDALPCNLLFALPQAPAYVLTDGAGTPNTRDGDAPDVSLLPELKFDAKTCPMCFFQGGVDDYSPFGSTQIYRQLRRMKIPAELHLFADRWHGFHGDMNRGDDGTGWDHWFRRAEEFIRQMNYDGRLGKEVKLMSRFPDDAARVVYEKEELWPVGKMPPGYTNQCTPFIEWHIPKELKTKAVQIIFSGGGYHWNKPEGMEVTPARRYLNGKGMTVVTLKYRSPRPAGGLAKHTSAWQDLQRAIRIVRAKVAAKGLDPDRIGIMGGSAGGHLALMGATSSRHRSYWPIDEIDKVPCTVQWAVAIYPAYALTDGVGCRNTHGGNGDDDRLVPEFSFDLDTCPVLFLHGDADGYSSMASVKVWEQLRRMGIQGELHTLASRDHCFQNKAAPGTGSYTYLDRIWEFLNHKGYNR